MAAVAISIPTVAALYATGNCVGGLLTLNGQGIGTSGAIVRAVLRDKAGQAVAYDLFLFGTLPAGNSNIADKQAIALGTDLAHVILTIPFVGIVAGGTPSLFTTTGYYPYATTVNDTLYGALVIRGAPTYSGTADLTLSLQTVSL